MIEKLISIHNNTVKNTPLKFKRYLFEQIDWSSNHICLTGARGVGKTTLLLQHYHQTYGSAEKCLYVSADNVEVSALGLFDLACEYFKFGGEAFIIDEIHKYPSWQIELKNIIDTFRAKKILISGSSSLDLRKGKADLSRRVAYYDLRGLSFREYLNLKEGRDFTALKLEDIFVNHVRMAGEFSSGASILKSFRDYLRSGYYPFFMESEATYLQKVFNVIEKVLYEDVTAAEQIKTANVSVLKKILWIIASSTPFSTNIEKLSRDLRISKEYVYKFLEYLEAAGLIVGLKPEARGFKLARKPTKLFIENTNLLNAINGELQTESEQGTMRETFFVNQLRARGKVSVADTGDFVVDGRYTFEIGGKSKASDQIKDAKHAYVAADGIEIGMGHKIPLYLFGFLY